MGRTIVVGDVHGCSAELEDLLERIGFSSADRLVFVGDLVARGPDSRGVLALMRQLDATSVRGNHEGKLLAWRRRAIPLGRVGKPEEIAGPVLFLCTEHASFITGEIFNVNGGAVLVG